MAVIERYLALKHGPGKYVGGGQGIAYSRHQWRWERNRIVEQMNVHEY
jgi:hypothetical protein